MIRRISEELQKDEPVMAALRRVGALPDKVVTLARGAEGGVLLGSGGETAEAGSGCIGRPSVGARGEGALRRP